MSAQKLRIAISLWTQSLCVIQRSGILEPAELLMWTCSNWVEVQ